MSNIDDFGSPKKQGSSELFVTFLVSDAFGAAPGRRMVPRPPLSPPRTPPNLDFGTIFDRFLVICCLFLCGFSHVSGSFFGGTRELPSKKPPLHKKREQRTMNKEPSTQKRTRNAERRTQPARWRGWPAGQLDPPRHCFSCANAGVMRHRL